MKAFWPAVAKALGVVVVIQACFLYDFYQKHQGLLADNTALESKVLATEKELNVAAARIEAMEKASLEGVLKESNKAIVSGWETLLDTVQGELNKAREAIPSLLGGEREDGDADSDGPQQDPALPAIEGERT